MLCDGRPSMHWESSLWSASSSVRRPAAFYLRHRPAARRCLRRAAAHGCAQSHVIWAPMGSFEDPHNRGVALGDGRSGLSRGCAQERKRLRNTALYSCSPYPPLASRRGPAANHRRTALASRLDAATFALALKYLKVKRVETPAPRECIENVHCSMPMPSPSPSCINCAST